MGRAPCCEKMGLKKGPWSHDEDQILISYIQQHGHVNWRALPKQAGLLRCGKSCRLRWTNYLRPDIKRGNFTKEEEDTIINLHQMLGNRWSTIAAKLPGRTDNEIKNVWHTHLKKKLSNYHTTTQVSKKRHLSTTKPEPGSSDPSNKPEQEPAIAQPETSCLEEPPVSPQQSCSELSSVTEATTDSSSLVKHEEMEYPSESFLDESFWSEALSGKETSMVETNLSDSSMLGFPLPPFTSVDDIEDTRNLINTDDGMDFWYDIFMGAEELPELPEF